MVKTTPRLAVTAILAILVSGFAAASPPQAAAVASPGPQRPKYELWVTLDDLTKTLTGREELVWVNPTRDEVPDMLFHLYWNAFKNEDSAFLREAARESLFSRGSLPEDGEWGWIDITSIRLADGTILGPTLEYVTPDGPDHPGDQTVARVVFPEPVQPGGTISLQIEFRSKIPRTVARSGYYRHSYFIAQWFPKPGVYEEGKGWNCHAYHETSEFFADFADFTVHITVPESFVVGSSGKQTGVSRNAAARTATTTFVQENIHDVAWTADPKFLRVERIFTAAEEVTPAEYEETARKLGLTTEEVRLPDVRMILLIRKEHKSQIDRHFKALRMAIKYYGLWYGPYPYETVTMVDPPFRTGSGGMEYPTLFTAGTNVITSPEANSPEGVIIHEFGHGYWYGLVANNEFEAAWLDEGVNTYSTGRVLATAYGPGVFSPYFKGIPLDRLFPMPKALDYETDRAAALQVVELDPVTAWSWKFYNGASYGMNVYMRASTILNTLERLLGEEAMMRLMRTYHMRWRFRYPTTADFIATVNEVAGRDLTWFFDELLFATHIFDYGIGRLESAEIPKHKLGVFEVAGLNEEMTRQKARELEAEEKTAAGVKEVKSYLTTLTLRRFGEAKVRGHTPLAFEVVFDDGTKEQGTWDGQDRWARFTFERPAKAVSAVVDPQRVWVIDADLSNNSYQVKPVRKGVVRLAAKLFFLLQNSLQFLAGLS